MSNLSDFMGKSMEKIREMVDVNTIIGNPITTPDGTTLIPVSKVSFGFASGGSDASIPQGTTSPVHYGAGSGAGVSVQPVAFVVINGGNVRMMYVNPPTRGAVDRVIDMAPDLIDKVREMLKKPEPETEEKTEPEIVY